MLENKVVWKHDFYGEWAPGNPHSLRSATFSVGVFQWLPKLNGQGIRKSEVKCRIKGYTNKPEDVFAKAREICKELDEGKMAQKTYRV